MIYTDIPADWLICTDHLYKKAHSKLGHCYGRQRNPLIEHLLERELAAITGTKSAIQYAFMADMKDALHKRNIKWEAKTSATLLNYILGISDINPLPPHWYCPACSVMEFPEDSSIKCGPDLSLRICKNCDNIMNSDGFNIFFESSHGWSGGKEIPQCIFTPECGKAMIIDHLLSTNEFYTKTVPGLWVLWMKTLEEQYSLNDNLPEILERFENEPQIMILESKVTDLLGKLQSATNQTVPSISSGLAELATHYMQMDFSDYVEIVSLALYGKEEDVTDFTKSYEFLKRAKPSFYTIMESISIYQCGDLYSHSSRPALPTAVISREDIFELLRILGLDKEAAFKAAEDVRKGKGVREQFRKDIPADIVNWLDHIKYMYPKTALAQEAKIELELVYYKVNFPHEWKKLANM